MLVPDSFKTAIANTFYDKTITKLTKALLTDSEGGVTKSGTTAAGTLKGNVRFDALGEVQSEIGLTEQIDIAVTCPPDTEYGDGGYGGSGYSGEIQVDDLFQYLGVKYVAVGVMPYDSHKMIVGRRWQVQ